MGTAWVGRGWDEACSLAEEPLHVVWFLAGPALGSDLLLPPTAAPSVPWVHHAYFGWVDFLGWILGRL